MLRISRPSDFLPVAESAYNAQIAQFGLAMNEKSSAVAWTQKHLIKIFFSNCQNTPTPKTSLTNFKSVWTQRRSCASQTQARKRQKILIKQNKGR